MSLLHPAKLNETTLTARFTLKSEDDTRALGQTFSNALNPDQHDCIGFIAGVGTGKSTLVKGIHEGLGATFGNFEEMMIMMNGMNVNSSAKGFLVRHFDLNTAPEGEENIPSHWRALEKGLEGKSGVELVEHAMKSRDERFNAVFVIEKDPKTQERYASLHCSDEMAARPELQNLLAIADI